MPIPFAEEYPMMSPLTILDAHARYSRCCKCVTMAAFRPLVALLLLFLAAVVGAGRVKHAPLDREDDDFAEFDFDAEEEWDDG